MDYFYKNAEGDEVLYVHDGKGVLFSQFGKLEIQAR
jgi:homogentisate 1,2-dioxygenase